MEDVQHRKSWWKRNWKWVVPTGGCLVLIVMFVAFVGTIFYGVTSMMKDSHAYVDAMEHAKNNPEVVRVLGTPIEQNGIMAGTINYSGGIGEAEITIPIKGPKGEASIYVEGSGTDDAWTYKKMNVFINESEQLIDLLQSKTLIDSIQ